MKDSNIIRFQKRKRIQDDDEMSDVGKQLSHSRCRGTTLNNLSSNSFKSELLYAHEGCSQPEPLSGPKYSPVVDKSSAR